MKEYYVLLRLNRKEYRIISIEEKEGKVLVELSNRKNKVRCPECNGFTGSVHDKWKNRALNLYEIFSMKALM